MKCGLCIMMTLIDFNGTYHTMVCKIKTREMKKGFSYAESHSADAFWVSRKSCF